MVYIVKLLTVFDINKIAKICKPPEKNILTPGVETTTVNNEA
jgi:hypothetical protein